MWQAIPSATREELRGLGGDRWLLKFSVVAPLAFALLFVAIFWSGTPRELPIAIVDLDRGHMARSFVRYLDASPTLMVSDHFDSVASGKSAIVDGSYYALVVIPADIERSVRLGQSPTITAFFNAQYLLIAKTIRSALLEIGMTVAVEADIARILVGTPNFSEAFAIASPVRTEIGSLYNQNLDYSQFLVPGIVFSMFQVLVSCVAVLVVSREFRWGGVGYWSRYGALPGLTGKMLPYTLIFSAQLMLLFFGFFGVLGWPYHAGLLAILPLLVFFVFACQTLGAFFYALTLNPERALGFAGAFSAPAFAFLGLTYPSSDMSSFAQFWRELMPAAHLADVYTARISYGAGVGTFALPALIFVAHLLLIPFVVERIQLQVEDHNEPTRSTNGA